MRPPNFDHDLTSLIRRAKMKFESRAKEDLLNALNNFTDLQPDVVNFTFPDGVPKWCLSFSGTIPIQYKGARYNIPVALYFLESHPNVGPFCYVKPTSCMRIRPSKVVDDSGRIYLPYLTEWRYPNHDTTGLLQVITIEFQEKCPVYSVSSNSKNTGHSNNPYPNSGSMTNLPYPTSALPYPTADPPSHIMPQPSSYTPMPQPGNYQAPYPNSYPSDPISYPNPATNMTPQSDGVYPYGTGTIQPTHIRASLLSAVEDRIRQRLRDKIGTPFAELQSIDVNLQELRVGKQNLRDMLDNIARDQRELERVLDIYTDKKKELASALKVVDSNGTTNNGVAFNEEQAIDAQTPVHRQILKCHVQDSAIDDTIYHLGQALHQGAVNLQTYLKYVRQLSKQQFQHRLLMYKCRDRSRLTT
ncbi:hypothetical protein niasHT_015353 [Heterodera trifolii]|uniref:Tumor susceptibility gene 101 protein n=1 Tax=Heterodera trifolii TaxID=157864 RepID=A0ABD2L016_9BILA